MNRLPETMQDWTASWIIDEPSDRASDLLVEAEPTVLQGERLLAAQAMMSLISIDRELREARADWNQDRFRRLMHARSKAVSRLRRRHQALNPQRTVPLGSLSRRYNANLARYLYEPKT